ncbi:MAG TPA: MaoC/PaaZ C-terminal domain-containing protein [Candidatus Dormibacteraeota bacterium]
MSRVVFTREQIAAYAEASGDRNPIHLDDDFARSVGLPGVIAHGMLQMGLLANLAVEAAGGDPRRVRRLNVRFAGMVEPGEEVEFGSASRADGRLELWARKADGTPVLTKGMAELA